MSSTAPRLPEEMAAFFDTRAGGYDAHMRETLGDSFDDYYAAVARPLAETAAAVRILDLGCGTGAEIAYILRRTPAAHFTCIDMSGEMLKRLAERYAANRKQLHLIAGSYTEVLLGTKQYDCAVSVMTMHHLLPGPKRALYARIQSALKAGGFYVEGDWYVSAEAALEYRQRYEAQMATVGSGLYHIDIPLTLEENRSLLIEAGFRAATVYWQSGTNAVILATA